MKHTNTRLSEIYYNPESTACYSSVKPLLREALKCKIPVSQKDVESFLQMQPTYTLHRRVVRRFKRMPTLSAGLHVNWQADLALMSDVLKFNKKFSYILVCVDVLSRQLFAEPLQHKSSAEVISAFRRIFKRSNFIPWRLGTDSGKEFTSSPVQKCFKDNEIQHYQMFTSPKFHAGMIERFIRTLKEKLYRHFTATGSYKWIGVLQKLVNSINSSINSSLGIAPKDINFENAQSLRKHLWQKAGVGKMETISHAYLKAGSRVRIEKHKHIFQKGYLANFTDEIFTISRVRKSRPPTFMLKGDDGEEIIGRFYAHDLSPVIHGNIKNDKIKYYVIEKILKTKKVEQELYYLVKWKGRCTFYNSWLNAKNVLI